MIPVGCKDRIYMCCFFVGLVGSNNRLGRIVEFIGEGWFGCIPNGHTTGFFFDRRVCIFKFSFSVVFSFAGSFITSHIILGVRRPSRNGGGSRLVC